MRDLLIGSEIELHIKKKKIQTFSVRSLQTETVTLEVTEKINVLREAQILCRGGGKLHPLNTLQCLEFLTLCKAHKVRIIIKIVHLSSYAKSTRPFCV